MSPKHMILVKESLNKLTMPKKKKKEESIVIIFLYLALLRMHLEYCFHFDATELETGRNG